jgi:CDGSH-type Zn-finger protein
MAEVTIKVRRDGPYKVTGPAIVRDAGGSAVSEGDADHVAILCRCGRTSTAPTCDLSHRRPPPAGPAA